MSGIIKSIKKVFKKIVKPIKKAFKQIMKNKYLRVIAIAAVTYFTAGGMSSMMAGNGFWAGVGNAGTSLASAGSSVMSGEFAAAGEALSAGYSGTTVAAQEAAKQVGSNVIAQQGGEKIVGEVVGQKVGEQATSQTINNALTKEAVKKVGEGVAEKTLLQKAGEFAMTNGGAAAISTAGQAYAGHLEQKEAEEQEEEERKRRLNNYYSGAPLLAGTYDFSDQDLSMNNLASPTLTVRDLATKVGG